MSAFLIILLFDTRLLVLYIFEPYHAKNNQFAVNKEFFDEKYRVLHFIGAQKIIF